MMPSPKERMEEFKAYVTFKIPQSKFNDKNYDKTLEILNKGLALIAFELEGTVWDNEVK